MSLLKKIGIWILAMITFMVGLAYALFFLNQDVIKNEILLGINRGIKGKLTIDEVGLSLFSNFPDATIDLDRVELYEYKVDSANESLNPVMILDQVEVSLNVMELVDGKVLIEKLMLDGGNIGLITSTDGSLNISNALTQLTIDSTSSENDVSISLNSLEISDFALNHFDEASKLYLASTINRLESTILISGDSLKGTLNVDYQLDSLADKNDVIMTQHTLMFSTDFKADMDKLSCLFTGGKVKFDLLEADLTGTYNYADSGYVDISISANHDDLSELASLELLNADFLPDIRNGKLSLTTTIQGKTIGHRPIINTVASLSELEVDNQFGNVIKDSGFRLNFYSGTGNEMRDGLLYIDQADIKFASGGYLSGDLLVVDFTEPVYKVNWQLEENLVDLTNIFSFPDIKEMNGTIRSQGRLRGNVDLQTKEFENPKGILRVQFENCQFVLSENDYSLKNVNGQLFMNEGEISLDNFTFNANGNQIHINSKVKNLLPYLLGASVELTTAFSIRTHKLDTYELLAFDPELQEKANYKLDSIDLDLTANFLSTDIDSFNILPTGKIEIHHLTTKINGLPFINKVKGIFEIQPDTFSISNLSGHIGESPLSLNLSLTNYDAYFQSDSVENMAIDLKLGSEKLVVKDFFTFDDQFVLPENYQGEVLNNIEFAANITTTNNELHKEGLIPEIGFQLTGLRFQTHYSPVVFRDISIFGLVSENNIYINSLFGKFGRSDVFMNAEFNNALATKDTISRPFRSRIGLNSQVLDLDELIKLGVKEDIKEATGPTNEPKNPYADDYPITDFSVNIGELHYYGAVVKNLSGILNLEENNVIKLNKVRLESGDYGSFEFEGVFDASSHEEAILTSSIKISNVDLSKLDVTYLEDGKEVQLGDHLKGIFNGGIEAIVPIHQDFSFDLNRLTGTINVVVMNGALVNYAPLQELSKYFKNKDLENVYFDDLINTMIFDKGKMELPYMTINTTLGTIFIMGHLTTDEEMALDIQVPVKLIAGAVLNSLFAANKGDDDEKDEIMEASKGKYVTVHVSGNTDDYKIKVGKRHSAGSGN